MRNEVILKNNVSLKLIPVLTDRLKAMGYQIEEKIKHKHIPILNGMEIAEKIREIDRHIKIIFISKKGELAYKGYLYNAFRFVRKSNLEQDLCETVKSLNESFSMQRKYLVFKTSKGEAVRAVEDIKYFEFKTHFINVVCNDGEIRIYGTLREYEEQIGNELFILAVNIAYNVIHSHSSFSGYDEIDAVQYCIFYRIRIFWR